MSQSNTGYDVWGVVASVLSLLILIPALINNLPINQARLFDSTLADTRCELCMYIEGGCLDGAFISKVTLQLGGLHADASQISEPYRARRIFHQIVSLLRLKSLKLSRMRREVEDIRTDIKIKSADAIGRRTSQDIVEPEKEELSPSDESDIDDLASLEGSTLQVEDDVEKALHTKCSTRDPPAYCAGFVDQTKPNTPKHRGWKTKAKGVLKRKVHFSRRR
ncbi:hypothetical protein FOMPIDRAFT_1047877 [Fomitopsis schrenkii]|uniref:Uncharacterized protein n=1 Tax=Fomitopsis schrenkii TaxID=2126942 RepID=S8FMH6_FOMSC|nr:hypothetical protein FOMPIDRAFT_1047877 [Fomitopsis schrenkii]